MSLRGLRRMGIALLLIAEASVAFSQTAPPAPAPAEQPGQTQETPPGQIPEQTPDQASAGDAGQTVNGDEQNGGSGSPATAQMPAPLNIDSSSLQFSSERARGNYLRGGVAGGVNYDDNLLSVATQPIGGLAYSVTPSLGIDISRARFSLDADYEGGYTFNQRFSAYNQSVDNALIDLRYRITRHVNFRIHDNFVLTTGFYDQLQSGNGSLGVGVIQQPNLGVATPFTRRTDDLGTAELTYQFSPSDTVGISATGDVSDYAKPPSGAPTLVDTRSEEADAFYSHRFSPRQSSGVAYTFERISFEPVIEPTDTQTIMLFHSLQLNPDLVISLFAGPEYTQVDSELVSTTVTLPYVTVTSTSVSQNRWSVAGGGSVSWKLRRTSLRASGSRKVSDGGGLLAAADLTSAVGAVRQQLTRNSSLEVGGLYADSHALSQEITNYLEVKSYSVSVLWEQIITRNITASFGFSREFQQQTTTAPSTLSANHDRGWVSVGYRFTRPLGR